MLLILSNAPLQLITVLVKSFAHLNQDFSLGSVEEGGKLSKWLTVYSGDLQMANFGGINICKGF